MFEDGFDHIPLDSIAFLIEVKSRMTVGNLEDDLEKLKKVEQLEVNPQRFNISVGGQYKTDKLLKILIYNNKSINEDKMNSLLDEYIAVWDFILIIQERPLLIMNRYNCRYLDP